MFYLTSAAQGVFWLSVHRPVSRPALQTIAVVVKVLAHVKPSADASAVSLLNSFLGVICDLNQLLNSAITDLLNAVRSLPL